VSTTKSPPTLDPKRILSHPLWLTSLVLLALNDHVLKGSGLLPGLMTGKLSDVAGLIVAPPLLALLLRVRSRQTLFACYLATGLIFSGLQLSSVFADMWVQALGGLGVGWQVWSDPWDMLTLPALALSWIILVPVMEATSTTHAKLGRLLAQRSIAALGVTCCIATSPPPEERVEIIETWTPISADVYLYNETQNEVLIAVRALRDDIIIYDCDALRGPVDDAWFDVERRFTVPPQAHLALTEEPEADHPCRMVWLQVTGVESPSVLSWNSNTIAFRNNIPGGGGSNVNGGRVSLSGDLSDRSITVSSDMTEWDVGVPSFPAGITIEDPSCTQVPDVHRTAWSPLPAINSAWMIDQSETTPEGCTTLVLSQPDVQGAEPTRWSFCSTPDIPWPFATGDLITFGTQNALDNPTVIITKILNIESTTPVITMTAQVGSATPGSSSVPFDMSLTDTGSCRAFQDACGNILRAGRLQIFDFDTTGDTRSFEQGSQTMVELRDGTLRQIFAPRAIERILINPSCGEFPSEGQTDLELVVIDTHP